MDHVAIDLHKLSSLLCVQCPDGSRQEVELPTERQALESFFGGQPRCRVLLESSTESEWVAQLLERLGHEAVVADPNFAAMYATRGRKLKTNRRDVRALLDALLAGNYRPAYRRCRKQRWVRQVVLVRDKLVRARSRLISACRSLLRQEGLRVGASKAEAFAKKVRGLALPRRLSALVEPLVKVLEELGGRLAKLEAHLARKAKASERLRRLTSVPGVGPVTALAWSALVDDPHRFSSGEAMACYLGLVPSEDSSADYRHRGRITKAGDAQVRWLLAECAQSVLNSRSEEGARLRQWGRKIAARSGRSKAVVALARKLSGVLLAIDKSGQAFRPDYEPIG